MNETLFKSLVDLRERTLQKGRIAFGNRVGAVERGSDTMTEDQLAVVKEWQSRFDDLEKIADEQIKTFSTGIPIVEAMITVKGVGRMLAAKVASMIDIDKAPTISSLWKYAGYAVVNGASEKKTKGEKLQYNWRLRTACYLVGASFLKCNSPYRAIYDSSKEFYQASKPEWSKIHVHEASMRRMIKLWLSHLWLVWRKIEGLPISQPYAFEKLGHQHVYTPEEFGWFSD